MKKVYTKPTLKTEKIEIGVFGCYGGTGWGDKDGEFDWNNWKPWKPFVPRKPKRRGWR